VIDLESGASPVTGTLTGLGGATHRFCGWLELINALQLSFAQDGEAEARDRELESI
jgi:hypothetical protein